MQKSNDSTKTIRIQCEGAATQPLEKLMVLQGGLKKLTKKNLDRLKARITTDGFCAPIFIWDNAGALMILDGTQRRAALVALQADGWTIPPLPVVYIYADDESQARRILLSISSQYGEWVEEELAAWLGKVDEEIRETLRFAYGEEERDEDRTDEHGLKKISFLVEEEQAEIIKRHLEKIKEENNLKRYGDALFTLFENE